MNKSDKIIGMLIAGGVYPDIPGENMQNVFQAAAGRINLPPGIDRQEFFTGLCEREELMTTSVGFGIALPHPRVSLISGEKDERIFVCYLENKIDFNAMDGLPVNNLFIILSDGSKNHLNVLSNLSYLFQQDQFREILALRPGIKELTAAVKQYLQ